MEQNHKVQIVIYFHASTLCWRHCFPNMINDVRFQVTRTANPHHALLRRYLHHLVCPALSETCVSETIFKKWSSLICFQKINTTCSFSFSRSLLLGLADLLLLVLNLRRRCQLYVCRLQKSSEEPSIWMEDKNGTFLRRKNSSLSSSSSSETMYASVLSILGMITCSIALTLKINFRKSPWNWY